MIEFVNSGKINTRLKGNKKEAIKNILADTRSTTVELIKSNQLKVKERDGIVGNE